MMFRRKTISSVILIKIANFKNIKQCTRFAKLSTTGKLISSKYLRKSTQQKSQADCFSNLIKLGQL